MEVFNKLYSTVSTTVSQLSGVLPGNPVTREYEISSYIASAGPGSLWKIYRGSKKSTKQDAAVFVFEKRCLERCSKTEQEQILEVFRRGVAQLTRLRHPQILTVQHPLEESRESLAFATEPVFTSLSNILDPVSNSNSDDNSKNESNKLYDVEIKHGLVQVGEGLAFLHNNVKLLHCNICPETILINHQGAWKIFGFDFCVLNTSCTESEPYWPFVEYAYNQHIWTRPNLDYLAPEYSLSFTHSPASDMFSLGQLIVSIYNSGQALFVNKDNWSLFKKNCMELKQLSESKLDFVPDGLRLYVKMMLNITPELRPDAHQFVKIDYFEDVGVKTLAYLDSLFQWDNFQKSQFYKGLPQIIPTLPHRVAVNRVLPCLIKEFVNPTMVPFVLPNVLLITEQCSKEEFIMHVLPHLKPVMKIQDPIQVLLIFMQKMELLLKLTPAEEIKSDVLPMIYRALESDIPQIQELCLSVLPTFAGLIDYPAMKNALLPRIKRVCASTQHVSVRVNCLVCIGRLLEHLDKWLVLDEVLPFLPTIPSREPAVLMGILGIYKIALTHKKLGITKEVMATKILPFLMPLSIENGLTLNQFNAFMSVIKEMVSKVEAEHRVKLEQLNSMEKAQRIPLDGSEKESDLKPTQGSAGEFEKVFLGLRLDNRTLAGSNSSQLSDLGKKAVNGTSNSLTLEEKQRLARQQEEQQRLQAQPILNTSPPPPSVPPSKLTQAKDLTGLLESNLNQMKWNVPHEQVNRGPSTYQGSQQNIGGQSETFSAFKAAPGIKANWNLPEQGIHGQAVNEASHAVSSVQTQLQTFCAFQATPLIQNKWNNSKKTSFADQGSLHSKSNTNSLNETFSAFQTASLIKNSHNKVPEWNVPVVGTIPSQQQTMQASFPNPLYSFAQTPFSPSMSSQDPFVQKPARKLSLTEIDDLLQ